MEDHKLERGVWKVGQEFMRAKDFIQESFNQPYSLKWEKGEHGDLDAFTNLDDGSKLSIMFNKPFNKNEPWMVEFYRNDSQDVTGEGDAYRIFATVLNAIEQFIKKVKPVGILFSSVEEADTTGSRAKLYDRMVQKYTSQLGYTFNKIDYHGEAGYSLTKTSNKKSVAEGKITLSTDPNWYGATVDNYQASGPVVKIPANQLVGFEPDDKMNQPKSQANVKKIVAGLKKGDKLPPLLVRKYKDGYQVLDGHHRFWAYKLLGTKSIPVQIVPAKDIEEISKQGVAENFADGKNPQDKGDSKRHGVPTKASVSTLRKVAKQGGRKGQLAHWMANMKSGRNK